MAHIYTDSYIGTQDKKGLERIAKDKFTDQATRDKAKALLAQKSGGSSSGSGTKAGGASPSPTGSGTTTSTAPGHLIPQGSGTTPGGGGVKTTGSTATKTTGSTGTKTGGAGSSSWLSSLGTLSDDQLNALASQNSQLWHTDPENRSRYEADNRAIKALLDQRNGTTSTLDPTTGKWTTTGGGSAAGASSAGGASGGGYAYKDKYGGGIAELDSQLNIYSQQYKDARARALAGDPSAVKEMREANDRANQLRNQYGYAAELATDDIAHAERQARALRGDTGMGAASAGGEVGVPQAQQPTQQLDYGDLFEQLKQYISQTQSSTPQYEPSQWEKTAEALAQAALGMRYEDWTQSGQYAALADRYGLQGQQSMQDMLGQVASRTGGLASSYAATAAQQQYNDYMSRLEEVARQMYAGERSDAIQNAQLAGQYSDRDYGRYLDKLSQYNRDRSFGFDVLSQALNQSNYQQEWQNKLEQQERQWQQAQYEDSLRWRADFRNRVDQFLYMGGTLEELYSQFPDLIEGSGYNNAELAARANYYANIRQQEMAALNPDAGSRDSGRPIENPAPKKPDGEVGAGALAFSNNTEAIDYMVEKGVPRDRASFVMSPSEWSRRKASYNQYGTGGTEVREYDTYADYLADYVQFCIESYGGK